MNSISADHITKTYGDVTALSAVSFSVAEGELFGLIGPDGAGKTTLFRILTTLLLPDSGHGSVMGCDVVSDYREIRRNVGYMPGKFSLYQDLTVEENLTFFASVFQTTVKENYDLIKDIYVQLEPFKNRRAGKLSGGMKQKLALCCALVHRPKILFLDEPTTGVDTVSRKEFWDMLARLQEQGITIMVSTPYMDEASRCGRIALIQSGTIMQVDTPANIMAGFPDALYAVKSADMGRLIEKLRRLDFVKSAYAFGEYHHVTLCGGASAENLKNELADETGLEIGETRPTIEDCFIRLMERKEKAA